MAHNDHLKEPSLERVRGTADGVYYKGVGAVMSPGYILIAPDMPSLIDLWSRLTSTPLNQNTCYQLAVFQQANIGEKQ